MTTNIERERARRRVESRPATDLAHRCRECGGPCRAWVSTRHGWTCRACLDRKVFGDNPVSAPEVLPLLSDLPSPRTLRENSRDDDDAAD